MDEIAQDAERYMSFQIQKALIMYIIENADLHLMLD